MFDFRTRDFWMREVATAGMVDVGVGHEHSDDFGTV